MQRKLGAVHKIQVMNIHQLSIQYIPEQDRVLTRINTANGDEFRLWFTRRISLALSPLLNRLIAEQAAKAAAKTIVSNLRDPAAKKDVPAVERSEMLQKSDFQTPYQEKPKTLPLGAEPLLVTELSATPLDSGQIQIQFTERLQFVVAAPPPPPEGATATISATPAVAPTIAPRGFQMALEPQLATGMSHLLERAIQTSEWLNTVGPASPTASGAG
jgi:hypothetical protein